MPPPQDHDDFGFRELRNPLHRAHDLENWYDHLSVWDQFKEENRLEYQDLRGILRGGKDPSTFPLGRMTRAIHLSLDEAMTMMGGESLNMGHALLAGIVPMLADLVEYVGGFALLGAGVGLLGGPFDEVTVPGGAATGAEFGLWLFGRVGLAKILYESATHLDRFTALAKDATELAVYAGEDRAVKVESDIHYAAKLYAAAIAELWWVILQALILYLLKRTAEIAGKVAGNAATSAMKTEAYQKALAEVRKSTTKFGTGFNDWFDNNIERIQQALEKRERELKAAENADKGKATESTESSPKSNKSVPHTETRNGYEYTFDEQGRVAHVEGDLDSNPAQGRNTKAQLSAGGDDRLPTDEGGHFVGRRFDGPTDDFNHFAQDMNFNRGAYKSLENSWQRALDNGSEVHVDITPNYSGDSLRLDSLDVNYTIDGVPYQKTFINQPGGQ